jgi:hypothetical protein
MLALLVRNVFADHDHAIGSVAGCRLVLEFGVLLAREPEDFIFSLANDPLLDVDRLPSRSGLYLVPRRSGELSPGRFGQIIRDFIQVR